MLKLSSANIKYSHIKSDGIALIKWNQSTYEDKPVYIGLVNDFIVAVCTEHSGIEYDAIAIRFRIRNYEFIKGEAKSKSVVTIYRHGYLLRDLKEGLWLNDDELLKVNDATDKVLDEFKIGFMTVK